MAKLRWLRRKLKRYSPAAFQRWIYRRGYRRGRHQGIEQGKREGQRIEVFNRCREHHVELSWHVVQLSDGRFVQGWFCPHWHLHFMQGPLPQAIQQVAFPDVERFTDKVPSAVTQQPPGAKLLNYLRETHSDAEAGPETTRHRAAQFPRQG